MGRNPESESPQPSRPDVDDVFEEVTLTPPPMGEGDVIGLVASDD